MVSQMQKKQTILYLHRAMLKSVLYLNCSSSLGSHSILFRRKKHGNVLFPFFRTALSKKPPSFLSAKLHPRNNNMRFSEIIFYIEKVNDIFHCRNKMGSKLGPSKRTTLGCGLG